MKTLNRRDFPGAQYPERIIQFGEGKIIPVLDLPRDELESFASAVTGRFRNPYIKHQLLSIALNGMTKFRTRILPQLLAGQKANGTLPARLTFALAALIAFYRGERNGETYPVQDDAHWLERYQQLWSQYRDRVIGTQELVAIVLPDSPIVRDRIVKRYHAKSRQPFDLLSEIGRQCVEVARSVKPRIRY